MDLTNDGSQGFMQLKSSTGDPCLPAEIYLEREHIGLECGVLDLSDRQLLHVVKGTACMEMIRRNFFL